jgi:hypothetical protein
LPYAHQTLHSTQPLCSASLTAPLTRILLAVHARYALFIHNEVELVLLKLTYFVLTSRVQQTPPRMGKQIKSVADALRDMHQTTPRQHLAPCVPLTRIVLGGLIPYR